MLSSGSPQGGPQRKPLRAEAQVISSILARRIDRGPGMVAAPRAGVSGSDAARRRARLACARRGRARRSREIPRQIRDRSRMTGMKLDRMKSIGAALDRPGFGCSSRPGVRPLSRGAPSLRGQRDLPLTPGGGQRGGGRDRDAGRGRNAGDASRRGSCGRLAPVDPCRLRETAGTPARRGACALPSCTRDRRARGCALLFSAADCPCQVSGARASLSPI